MADQLQRTALDLNSQGRYGDAVPLAEQVLEIRKALLGEQHPAYVKSLSNLGVFYSASGDYPKAEQILREAIAIREISLDKQHPDYAESLYSSALLYRSMGDDEKAEPLFRAATAVQENQKAPKHAIAEALDPVSKALTRGWTEAKPLGEESLNLSRELTGPESNETAIGLRNLARIYLELGDSRARELYEAAIAICQKNLGMHHQRTVNYRIECAWTD